jgi:FolB domain-containing protein
MENFAQAFKEFDTQSFMGKNGFVWFYGVVEDRHDPLYLGRVRVRCIGWHTDNTKLTATQKTEETTLKESSKYREAIYKAGVTVKGTDISNASNSDVIDDTVDYKAVSKTLKSFIGNSEFQLIEALAEESVKLIFEKFNVNYIKGRFSKPGAVTGSKEVGVIIERYRDST